MSLVRFFLNHAGYLTPNHLVPYLSKPASALNSAIENAKNTHLEKLRIAGEVSHYRTFKQTRVRTMPIDVYVWNGNATFRKPTLWEHAFMTTDIILNFCYLAYTNEWDITVFRHKVIIDSSGEKYRPDAIIRINTGSYNLDFIIEAERKGFNDNTGIVKSKIPKILSLKRPLKIMDNHETDESIGAGAKFLFIQCSPYTNVFERPPEFTAQRIKRDDKRTDDLVKALKQLKIPEDKKSYFLFKPLHLIWGINKKWLDLNGERKSLILNTGGEK